MQQASSFNITSKHYIDRIDTDIIQLVRTISVEQQISIDEAKEQARKILLQKIYNLVDDELAENLQFLKDPDIVYKDSDLVTYIIKRFFL